MAEFDFEKECFFMQELDICQLVGCGVYPLLIAIGYSKVKVSNKILVEVNSEKVHPLRDIKLGCKVGNDCYLSL